MTQCEVPRARFCSGLAPALGRCRGTYRKQARAMGKRRGAPRGSLSPDTRRGARESESERERRARAALTPPHSRIRPPRGLGAPRCRGAPPSRTEAYKRTEKGRVLSGLCRNGHGALAVLAAHNRPAPRTRAALANSRGGAHPPPSAQAGFFCCCRANP